MIHKYSTIIRSLDDCSQQFYPLMLTSFLNSSGIFVQFRSKPWGHFSLQGKSSCLFVSVHNPAIKTYRLFFKFYSFMSSVCQFWQVTPTAHDSNYCRPVTVPPLPAPRDRPYTTGVFVPYFFRTAVWLILRPLSIDHFTVVGQVPQPSSECEAEVDYVLIQSSFVFLWKLC